MFTWLKHFFFTNHTTRQTVAKNTFWMAVGQMGGRVIRAVVIIYAARVLGAAEWGAFSYAMSFAAFLTIFTDLGLSPVLTRETAKTQDEKIKSEILSTALVLKISLLFCAGLLVVFAGPRFTVIDATVSLFPLIALVVMFDGFREFGFALTRAKERMEWEAGLFLLTNAAIVVAGFIALSYAPSVFWFTAAYAIGTGVGAVATYFALRRYVVNIFRHFSLKLVRPLFQSAWPFAISTALGALMINTDLLVIGLLRPAEDVGFYSAAEKIILILYLFPGILASATFPTLARFASEGNDKLRTALERSIAMIFLVAIPMALGGIIVAPYLISFLYGASYLPAVPSFQILLLAVLVNFPAALISNALFAMNRQKDLVAFVAIGGIANIILDFILIPLFGIVGSAWATLGAQLLSNTYLWRTLKKTQPFSVFTHLRHVLVGSAVVVAVTWGTLFLTQNLFAALAVAFASYFGTLYYFREPLLKEIKTTLRPSA